MRERQHKDRRARAVPCGGVAENWTRRGLLAVPSACPGVPRKPTIKLWPEFPRAIQRPPSPTSLRGPLT
ncbi:hypothetical protein BKA80DRAFT_106129 [Phyllosticta citrichinensis]